MPKSKNRGGAKAHKKRVNKRNAEIREQRRLYESKREEFLQQLIQQHEESKKLENQEEEGKDNIDDIII